MCGVDEPLYDYDVEEKILNMGYAIPVPWEPIANYVPAVCFSGSAETTLVYVSGTGPKMVSGVYITGRC